jgi:hypothetical protein
LFASTADGSFIWGCHIFICFSLSVRFIFSYSFVFFCFPLFKRFVQGTLHLSNLIIRFVWTLINCIRYLLRTFVMSQAKLCFQILKINVCRNCFLSVCEQIFIAK